MSSFYIGLGFILVLYYVSLFNLYIRLIESSIFVKRKILNHFFHLTLSLPG